MNGRSPGWLRKFAILTSGTANVPVGFSHLGLLLLYREAQQSAAELIPDVFLSSVQDYPKNRHPGWSRGSIAYHAGGYCILPATKSALISAFIPFNLGKSQRRVLLMTLFQVRGKVLVFLE